MYPFYGSGMPNQNYFPRNATVNVIVEGKGIRQAFECPVTACFGDLKDLMAEQLRIPRELIRLKFRGNYMPDKESFMTTGVKNGSRILIAIADPEPNAAAAHSAYAHARAAHAAHPSGSRSHADAYSSAIPQGYHHPTGWGPAERGAAQQDALHPGPHPQAHSSTRSSHPAQHGHAAPSVSQRQPQASDWDTFFPAAIAEQDRSHRAGPARPVSDMNQGGVGGASTAVRPHEGHGISAEHPLSASAPAVPPADQMSPETQASLRAISAVAKDVDVLVGKVSPGLGAREAAMLKEQLTQKLLVLDDTPVTPESRPTRKALITRIDHACDRLQELEAADLPK